MSATNKQFAGLSSGSRWNRWEPHVHAPGTTINDQFKGKERWEQYILALETSTPEICALGITDYYSTETYQLVCEAKKNRLPKCKLVFPNIEMRLALGTVKGSWVNIHLLVSPEDPNHIVEVERFLARLSFDAFDDSFCCSKSDLLRLGRHVNSELTETVDLLELGSQQFKVSFPNLKEIYQSSAWAKQNILIAVAGSETDGISGVREAADATLRQEVEKFAHIIFASSPAQREYWLGQRKVTEDEIRQRYGSLKPCMHGSDAHEHKTVGLPDERRFSWIKGEPSFDTLRQACIDPLRAYVGIEPPVNSTPSLIIEGIAINGADWAKTPALAFNPGLVAIIGARGSGKTALADIIALACDATERLSPASFLVRANEFLSESSVSIKWQGGDSNSRLLDRTDEYLIDRYPRARYLSQQFVEELCTAGGMTDELLREIERVIFESHTIADRDGAVDFQELLEFRVSRYRDIRLREEITLAELSERIGNELEKDKLVVGLKKQLQDKEKQIAAYSRDQSKLIAKGSEDRARRLVSLAEAAEKVRGYIRYFTTQEKTLLAMQDEVKNFRDYQAPEALRKSKEKHKQSGFEQEEWEEFLTDYNGDVDGSIASYLTKARDNAKQWRGEPPSVANPLQPLIADDANLEQQTLTLIETEMSRLEKLVNLDKETARRFTTLSNRIAQEQTQLKALNDKLIDCQAAKERAKKLVGERETAYIRVFEAIVAEQTVLMDLYDPLMKRLGAAHGTLNKMSFTVSREVDVESWANEGESLLDLRHKGPFKGRGALLQLANAALKEAWETGDPQSICEAMKKFRDDNERNLLEHSPIPKGEESDYRTWSKRFAKWLYGTEHISIHYSINYDGADIRKLSPGTRGIVLLLLYLALDNADDRPLIIDQPEESLDPKSVFDELVKLFVEAKKKRQVIIVTHNANLVINTDADQIIIASVGNHSRGELPPISYQSGGLENAHIRKSVCDILEGGERAFQERARRLRVRLER